jgi:hypothetical protein
MRISPTALLLALLATACSGPGSSGPGSSGPGSSGQGTATRNAPGQRVAQTPARPAQPAFTGGNAIKRSEVPYNQLLAEARGTGKPAVLFFWTSW